MLTMFTLQASKFDIYVHYCTNKPKSTEVLMAAGDTYFQVGCQNNRYHQCPYHSCCFHSSYLFNIHQNFCWLISVIMTITNSTILNIISSSHHLDNHHYLHHFHHHYYFLSVIIIIIISCRWSYYHLFSVIILATSRPQSQGLQRAAGVEQPISAYLIKPVQRLVYKFCALFMFTF